MISSIRLRTIFALLLVIAAIYALGMNRAGLWDPWETHYGEVARNIVARSDPMDLRWRPGVGPDGRYETLFRSKHVLPFWGMALGLKAFDLGVNKIPSEMVTQPTVEWALRLPSMIAGLGAAFFLAWALSKVIRPSAGFFALLVLGTMPHFALISRQAITDIYFVAPLIVGFAAWTLAMVAPNRELHFRYRLNLRESASWYTIAAIFIFAGIPWAMLYFYAGAQSTFARVFAWRDHAGAPRVQDLEAIVSQFRWYIPAFAILALSVVRARNTRELWLFIVYLAAGLAFMGKGLIGPGILGICLFADSWVGGYWFDRNRRNALLRTLLPGVLLFIASCAPWHHAMAIFRGEGFVNELLIVNNLERFIDGEQSHAVGDIAYYFSVLGTAACPWIVFLPWAVPWAASEMRGKSANEATRADESAVHVRRASVVRLFGLTFVLSLAIITASATKYAHYLVPALPGLAVIIGIWLDARFGGEEADQTETFGLPFAIAVIALVTTLAGLYFEPAALVHLTTYLYTGDWREGAPVPWIFGTFVVLGALAGVVALRLRKPSKWRALSWRLLMVSNLMAIAALFSDYIPKASENWSQKSAMLHYFKERTRGEELMSAWFYHRGETFFTKARVWVLMEPDGKKLRAHVREVHEKVETGKTKHLWIITSRKNLAKVKRFLPRELQDDVEVVYENVHLTLFRIKLVGTLSPLEQKQVGREDEAASEESAESLVPAVPGRIESSESAEGSE
jgi:4-amino-4-deoxy-L-arabinose transferase-like glycosyltransferase